ncbi:hypothetical protein Trydic_g19159 [Trypoxylus dichotomus]
MIRKSMNLLLTRTFSGCLSSTFRNPHINLQEIIQIIVDTGYLEEATIYMDQFISNITGEETRGVTAGVVQGQPVMFRVAREDAVKQICEKLKQKVDEFLELESYDWLLVEPQGQASTFISDLIEYLNTTFVSFTNLPPEVAQVACKSVCQHIADSMLSKLLLENIKQISMGALNQVNLDLLQCEQFAARGPVKDLQDDVLLSYFAKLREILDLITSWDWPTYFHDYGQETSKYKLVTPDVAITILEKLKEGDKRTMFSVLKKSERDKKKLLETVLKQLRQLSQIPPRTCMTIVILILAIVKQKALIEVLQKLIAIDEHLRQSEILPIYKYCTRFAIMQVVIITCIFTLKLILQVLNDAEASLLVYGVFNIVDYINAVMLLQFVNLLLLMRQRFTWLNRKLEKLSKSANISLYIDEKKVMPLMPAMIGVYKQTKPEVLLANLGKIYGELCHECRLVNRCFDIQILFTLIGRTIMLTAQLVNVYNIIKSSKKDYLQTVSETVYLMLHAFVIFVLASVAGETSSQARFTGVYLHDMWDCIPSLRNEIEYFSLQILHQDLNFTACEFFILDKRLVYGVVGVVTTYLIIIILVIGGMCYNAYLVETLEQQKVMAAVALKCELYLDLLLLIRQRFIWMNRKLRQLNNYAYHFEMQIPLTPIVTNDKKQPISIKLDSELILSNLAMIYGKLCKLSRLVNQTYGIQILVTVGSRFVMITTQLINTYNIIRDPKLGNPIQYTIIFIYLLLHSSKIFMIASLSENTAAKAKQTGIYLHNIWRVMPKIKSQIDYFSLQILHQNLTFTACGFFIMDYTLIYAIVGAITTYLIIVIQLEKAF